MLVLLVDDTRTNVLVVRSYLEHMGHEVQVAENGAIAVEAVRAETPDLILMDVMMPVMDGHEATRKIRTLLGEEGWVPIIFLSARVLDSDVADGIASGADDYLVKPVSQVVLKAKIMAMKRISEMRKDLQLQAKKIAQQSAREAEELEIAQPVFHQLNRMAAIDDSRIFIRTEASASFNGDIVASAYTPSGRLHVLLGDATGHGLAAGLTILPVTDTFYSMTSRGSELTELVIELNSKLRRVLPEGRFVAAIVVSIDLKSGELQLWNGGNPPALCIDKAGAIAKEFPPTNLALGILSPEEFVPKISVFQCGSVEEPRLYLYSDGIYEAESSEINEPFGMERLKACLSGVASEQTAETRTEALFDQIKMFAGGQESADDMTLLELLCGDH